MTTAADPPALPRKRLALRRPLLILLALTLPTGFWAARCMMPADPPKPAGGEITVGGVPLFATWPAGVKPEVAIVLTGQTFGYMSPCGCSRPQKGGLERRANLLKDLRAKGWPVMAVDLGDIALTPKKFQEQDLLKYKYTMTALRDMGYSAVGLGIQDFEQQLIQLSVAYMSQKGNDRPAVLASNLLGADGKGTGGFDRTSIETYKVGTYTVASEDRLAGPKPLPHLPVGVVGLLGPAVAQKLQQIDNAKDFSVESAAQTLPGLLAALKADPQKPAINVLLYAGSKDDTPDLAKKYPDFNIILCQSEDSEPPQFPTVENNGRTFVIQVGHKGQNVGVVGVFKNGNGYELKYQLIPVGEEFMTPENDPAAAKANTSLQLLEEYTAKVRRDGLLAKVAAKQTPHAAQIANPAAKLSYVGSAQCQTCHPNEYTIWEKSHHSHAMAELEKKQREGPTNRNFDPDCVKCHTVGFGYDTGYTTAEATPQLKHVGCESCHGPGSGHAAQPRNAALLASLSKWKANPGDVLPAKDVLEKLAEQKPGESNPVQITPGQSRHITAVSTMCNSCHDQENDPKFDINKYMPKIWHSGFKAATPAGNAANGLPPNAK